MLTYVKQGVGHALGWMLAKLVLWVCGLLVLALQGLVLVGAWYQALVVTLVGLLTVWLLTRAGRRLCRMMQGF